MLSEARNKQHWIVSEPIMHNPRPVGVAPASSSLHYHPGMPGEAGLAPAVAGALCTSAKRAACAHKPGPLRDRTTRAFRTRSAGPRHAAKQSHGHQKSAVYTMHLDPHAKRGTKTARFAQYIWTPMPKKCTKTARYSPCAPMRSCQLDCRLKVVISLMIGVGAMNSGVQATPKKWGLSRIDCLANPTLTQTNGKPRGNT